MPRDVQVARLSLAGALGLASTIAFGQVPSSGSGQQFPTKAVRIMTTAVGGGNDMMSRLIANGITGGLGQPVVVENRVIVQSIEAVSKSPPDGHSMLVSGVSLWITPLLQKTAHDVREFSPVSMLSRQVLVVAVHPSLPAKSVKELIALAKARPGVLNYGSGPMGSSSHLAPELFKSLAGGLDIVRIGFKGSAPALTALLTGDVHVVITDAGNVAPHSKSGRLRALAVTSADPFSLAPGLPTVAAAGVPGYESISVTGAWVAAKTPTAIINRLNQEIVRAMSTPDAKERVLSAGEEVVASSAEQFAAFVKTDIARMGKLIREAGIKAE